MNKNIYIEDIPSIELGGQLYTSEDTSLISSFETGSNFNPDKDYIEYLVFNGNKQVVDTVSNLGTYRLYDNDLNIFPEQDLDDRGYNQGQYYTLYHFLTPLLSSSVDSPYYISEISSDRTEIRLASTDIIANDILTGAEALINNLETLPYYEDFFLNFGANNLIIANNILIDETDPEELTLLIKLYEPLPDQFQINSQTWAVEKIAESRAYLINIQTSFDAQDGLIKLAGPNLNLPIKSQENKSTDLTNTAALKQTDSNALRNQLDSALNVPGVELNIDYSDFSNFIFFSSARTRLENYYYKLGLIEEYNYSASLNTESGSYYNSGSLAYWETKINETITNFDGFEYYLYYESGSTAWPKSNDTPPYVNVPTTSSAGQTWLTDRLSDADTFDNDNKDLLNLTIPEFIKNDPANSNYELFVDMAGQLYDEIWLYLKDVTQKYNTTNGVDQGISKDLVAQALKDVGIKLYQNNFTSDDLYSTYLGITPSGSLLPNTGQELIETYVTASATGSLVPINNLSSEVHKRLYHNLPVLLKKKGTAAGLRNLINAFGIPDTILRINEFGDKDRNNNTWDYWQNEYDYAFNTQGTNFLTSSFSVNTAWGASDDVPGAVAFRFKTFGIPSESNYSQSLWSTDSNNALRLRYVGTADISGSYSGSIVNPYNKYGRLEFFPDSTDLNSSASLYLPFFDGGWWSVLVNKNSDSSFTVYSGNSIYDGNDGNTLGFTAADSVTKLGNWSGSIESYFGSSSLDATLFSGSLQEIRYYKNPISQSVFNDFIMNPDSIEGNGINTSADQLIFRAALGSELYTGSVSIHPKVSGQWTTTASFASDSSFYFNSTPVYQANTGIGFYDQPAAGIKNAVSNKIRLEDSTLYGTTLSGLASLQQNYPASQSYTRNVNYLEVGYSPQNEINEDIMDSIGYFNIGEYIGDPRQISSSNLVYPALEELNKDYFKKYNKSYNYQDYFRIIKFYDNSLFKMIKDFIPARTAAATGAIVKQHLLERNRQRPAQLTWTRPEYSASLLSVARDYETGSIGVFDGGPAGAVNNWINVSQSYTASVLGPEGLVTYIESSEYEFYNGAYSGSTIECQLSESINTTPLLNNVSSSRLSIKYEDVDYSSDALNPVNLSLIQSGSAQKAAIQDSNYDPKSAFFETRFGGTKNTGEYNFTENIASQSLTAQYPVDYFTPYFAYFDWVGGSNPQYPGGGNIHCLYLVNAETGDTFTLSQENKYLDNMSQIFKKDDSVYMLPISASSGNQLYSSTIVEGAARYDTILYRSGSSEEIAFIANYETGQPGYSASLNLDFNISTGKYELRDLGSANGGWIYTLQTTSSTALGQLIPSASYAIPSGSNFGIYNKRTGEYLTASDTDYIQGALSASIAKVDTYLPLQNGDFIRFGSSTGVPLGVDDAFKKGDNFTTIKEVTLGADYQNNSVIDPLPNYFSTVKVNEEQNYRIFRRVPDETFTLINSLGYTGAGLLIPKNFNPKYDPVKIAKEQNII